MRAVFVLGLWLVWSVEVLALPKVLVIESYHADYAWDQGYTQALREELAGQAELSFFQMDTKRLPPGLFASRAEAAWQFFIDIQPDLVVLGDDNALRLLGNRFAKTETPVIYLGINQNPRRYFDFIPANVSGVLERPLLKRSVAYLNQIFPVKRALVLFDDGVTSQTVMEEAFSGESRQRIGSTLVEIRLVGELDEWQSLIETAPGQGFDLVVVGLYHTLRDAKGQHVDENEVLSWTSQHSRLPLFAFWAFAVGQNMTAGGLVLDPHEQGRAAATMVRKTLQTGQVPRLPVTAQGGRLLFSRTEMARWGLSLPPRLEGQADWLP